MSKKRNQSNREAWGLAFAAFVAGLVVMHIFYTWLGKSRGWF